MREIIERGEGHERRQVEGRARVLSHQCFKTRPSLGEGRRADVLAAIEQQIIDAQQRRKFAQHFGGGRLAVEALLQIGEGPDGVAIAHKQFAIKDDIGEGRGQQRLDHVGKGAAHVLASARVKPRDARPIGARDNRRLHAHAIPFPFGDIIARVECRDVVGRQRVGEHGRAKRRGVVADGPGATALGPCEQVDIGRRETVPDFLDRLDANVAQRGDRRLGETRGNADAQGAGEQLQQRPAAGLVEIVEKTREQRRRVALARRTQRIDDNRQRGRGRSVVMARGINGPHQRDGLGEIADEIIRKREKLGIDALGDQRAHRSRANAGDRQRARHGGEREAAIWIGRFAEIGGE